MNALPEIRESEAVGDIAKLYSDIRATQRLNNVNYIWRHLATIPGALEVAWSKSRDREDDIHAFGERLWSHACALISREPCLRPNLERFSAPVAAVLDTYARGNRWNLAAVSGLLGQPLSKELVPRPAAQSRPRSIPTMPRFDDLSLELRKAINLLAMAGPAADTAIRPSLWVHLALFPDLLLTLTPDLTAVLQSAPFSTAHRSLLEVCTSGANFDPSPLPSAAVTSLRLFQRRIAEITLIGAMLAADQTSE